MPLIYVNQVGGQDSLLFDGWSMVLDSGGKGIGMRLRPNERRFDIGNFESYFRAFTEFALADPKYGEDLRQFVHGLLNGER